MTSSASSGSGEGPVTVVTGGASGIGAAICAELAARGHRVVVTDLDAAAAQALAATLPEAMALPLDVTLPAQSRDVVQQVIARWGRLDGWVSNAGVSRMARFLDIDEAQFDFTLDVNLKGLIYGSHIALRQFRKQGAGTLVNIGSVESVVPQALHSSYGATKAATLSLGRSLNEELRLSGAQGIKVSTVLPWATDTPFEQL